MNVVVRLVEAESSVGVQPCEDLARRGRVGRHGNESVAKLVLLSRFKIWRRVSESC